MIEQCNTLPDNIYTEPSGKQSEFNELSELLNKQIEIEINPNPFENNISIKSNEEGKLMYEIYNIEGKILLNGAFYQAYWIDLSIFNNGIYLIKFYKNNHVIFTVKIIKL